MIAVPAAAHQETVAFSSMVIGESGDVEYALKIPVEDLGESLGKNGHAVLDALEVRANEERLFKYFAPLVSVSSGGAPCPAKRNGFDVPEDDRLFGEMRFLFHCPPGAPVTLDYRVFFDVDPGHVGMLEVQGPGGKTRAELIVERPRWKIHAPAEGPPQAQFLEGPEAPPAREWLRAATPKPVKATLKPESAEEAALVERWEGRKSAEDLPTTAPKGPKVWTLILPFASVVALASVGLLIVRARRRVARG